MLELTSTEEYKTYYGNCHCGAFRFSIKMPELTEARECNSSICFRKGYKWVFPEAGCFTVEKGEGSLIDYEFGKRSMYHKFCPTCGIGVMGKRHREPPGLDIAVNARVLQDVDVLSLEVHKNNGAVLNPQYKPPAFTGPQPTAKFGNGKTYYGSCHCGAITLAFNAKGPLNNEEGAIGECDCSICLRAGRVLTYLSPNQISVSLAPGIRLSSYSFASKRYEHKFCPVCGVAVCVEDTQTEDEASLAVNLRCFEGIEWGEIKPVMAHSSRLEPTYVIPK